MLFVKESPRWLLKRERYDEAHKNLIWLRGGPSAAVEAEWVEIAEGVRADVQARKGRKWQDFISPINRRRILSVVLMQLGKHPTVTSCTTFVHILMNNRHSTHWEYISWILCPSNLPVRWRWRKEDADHWLLWYRESGLRYHLRRTLPSLTNLNTANTTRLSQLSIASAARYLSCAVLVPWAHSC